MASRSMGSIYAELTIRDKMSKGLTSARKQLNAFGGTSLRYASLATAAFSAAMIVGSKRTMAMGGTLDDLSVNTGIAVGEVMKLRKQFELGGLSADSMGGSIARMQRAISTAAGGGKDPFAAMGLSAERLKNMAPDEAFRLVGEALLGIEGSTARAAAAMEIFGRSGAAMLNVFGQANDADQFLGRMPEIMQRFAGSLARMDDLTNELPNKGQQFVTGFTAGIIGQILPALEKTAAFDFTTIGENLGLALSDGVNIITSGDAWNLFALHAEKVLKTMQSGTAINGLAAAINTAIDPQIWTAFALAGEKAILSLQTSPAINGLAAGINALFDFGAGEEFGASFTKYMQAGKDANQDLIDDINAKLSDLPTTAETFAKFMEAGTESAIDNIDEIQAKIDAINRKAKEQTIMQRDAAAAINAEEKAAQEKAMAESLAGSAGASSLANDYARRGLSLDASGSGNLANRTNKAVESILSLLIKNFRVTREPVF